MSAIQENYLKEQERRNFKSGDKVRVLRCAGSYEKGWQDSWVDRMDLCVGKTLTVYSISDGGVRCKCDNISGGWSTYNFPHFVLEKLSEPLQDSQSSQDNDITVFEIKCCANCINYIERILTNGWFEVIAKHTKQVWIGI